MIDLVKAARQQMAGGLFAADAAGAEHRDLAMPGRIEPLRNEILELSEALDLRIDRAFERAYRHLEGVARVNQERVFAPDQGVPFGGFDIDSNLPGRIGLGIAALIMPAVSAASGGMIQLPGVMPQTWLVGLLLMLAIGVVVGLLPALRGMRLNIVDALAGR